MVVDGWSLRPRGPKPSNGPGRLADIQWDSGVVPVAPTAAKSMFVTRRLIAGGPRRRVSLPAVRPTGHHHADDAPPYIPRGSLRPPPVPSAGCIRPLSAETSRRIRGYRSLLDDADEAMRRDSPAEFEMYLRGREEYRRRRAEREAAARARKEAGAVGEGGGRRPGRVGGATVGPITAVDEAESESDGEPRSDRWGAQWRRRGQDADATGARSEGGFRGLVRREQRDGPGAETGRGIRDGRSDARGGGDGSPAPDGASETSPRDDADGGGVLPWYKQREDMTSYEAERSGDGGESSGPSGVRPSGDVASAAPGESGSRGIIGGAAGISDGGSGGGGIMSSISRSVKAGQSGRVSLEELFPTLYGRGARPPKAPEPPPEADFICF